MKIRLKLIGPLRLPPQGHAAEFECRKGTRVRTLLTRALSYSAKELRFIQIIRDGRTVNLDEKLTEDSELQIIMRLGGG